MIDAALLVNLVPLHTLEQDLLERFAARLSLDALPAGATLCSEGEAEADAIYLIEGGVELSSKKSAMKRVLQGHTPDAAYSLAPGTPREFTVRAMTAVKIVRVPREQLDRLMLFEQLTTIITTIEAGKAPQAGVEPHVAAAVAGKNMFRELPRQQLADLLDRMQEVAVKASEVVLRQGEASEYFYVVQEGRFVESRKDAAGKVQIVGELGPGTAFGQDSLLTGAPYPSSVVAIGPGKLRRLAKTHFEALLRR